MCFDDRDGVNRQENNASIVAACPMTLKKTLSRTLCRSGKRYKLPQNVTRRRIVRCENRPADSPDIPIEHEPEKMVAPVKTLSQDGDDVT